MRSITFAERVGGVRSMMNATMLSKGCNRDRIAHAVRLAHPLRSGERLFDDVGGDLHGLELVRTVATPTVTHLKFARSTKNRSS